jgi:hypothetical protein
MFYLSAIFRYPSRVLPRKCLPLYIYFFLPTGYTAPLFVCVAGSFTVPLAESTPDPPTWSSVRQPAWTDSFSD